MLTETDYCWFCGANVPATPYPRIDTDEVLYLCDLCSHITPRQMKEATFLKPIMFAANEILKTLKGGAHDSKD